MFGVKRKIPLDTAARLFMEHCAGEGTKLLARFLLPWPRLREKAGPERDPFQIRACPPSAPGHRVADRAVIEMHCRAIIFAVALASVDRCVDPPSLSRDVLRTLHRLIAAADVGEENVGRAPSPWLSPDVHVSYAPGTFVGGVPSELHELTKRYLAFPRASEKLTVLLASVGEICPTDGIKFRLFSEIPIAPGLVARNTIAFSDPNPDQIRSWSDELVITDAKAALHEIPQAIALELTSAIAQIDPFWPSYARRHRLR